MNKSYIVSTISISLLLLLIGVVASFYLSPKSSVDLKGDMGVRLNVAVDISDSTVTIVDNEHILSRIDGVAKVSYKPDLSLVILPNIKNDSVIYNAAIFEIIPVNIDSVDRVALTLAQTQEVISVEYPSETVRQIMGVKDLIRKLGIGIGILVLIVTIALMYYTLRLSLLAQESQISTMQLVGARDRFIRAPYIRRAVFQGFIAALLAVVMLIIFFEIKNMTLYKFSVATGEYWSGMGVIISLLVVIGVILCTILTFIVVSATLNKLRNR